MQPLYYHQKLNVRVASAIAEQSPRHFCRWRGPMCPHTKKKTIAAARDIRTKFQDKALGYEENWQKCLGTEQNQL